MREKRTPFAEQFRPIIAAAMDDGWTTMQLRDAFEQVVEIERDARMNAVAAKTYGRAAAIEDEPATTNTTPQAAALVARHKLPRGTYGVATDTAPLVNQVGNAFDAVAHALATGKTCRLYRNADGWRFVGVIHPDGSFIDERAS